MSEVKEELNKFLIDNNILIFTFYRVNNIHLLTYPYPLYTTYITQPIILPFEKGTIVYDGTCVVSYVLKEISDKVINWDIIRNIIYNRILYILDYATNYMIYYNLNYRYYYNEGDIDQINDLAQNSYIFNNFLMKSGKINYQTSSIFELLSVLKNNENIKFNIEDDLLPVIITYNIYLINIINYNTCQCELVKVNNSIKLSIIYNNDTTKNHLSITNRLIIDYFIELYSGSIYKLSQTTNILNLFLPIVHNIFTYTEQLHKLKDKYMLFISSNIRIDISLNKILNSYSMDYRICNYNSFCNNIDTIPKEERIITEYIKNNNNNNSLHVESSIQSIYDSSTSLILTNNYSKRKPNIIVFIIVNNSQRILIEECKKNIDKIWTDINYLCLYDYEPFTNISFCKCLKMPISSEILYDCINQQHGIMKLIGYKNKRKSFIKEQKINYPEYLIIVDNNLEKSLTYRYIITLIKIPIIIVNSYSDFVDNCKQCKNKVSIIIDENINSFIISNICSLIDKLNIKIKLAIVVESEINFNNYIHTNIKYHISKPFNSDFIIELLNNLDIV